MPGDARLLRPPGHVSPRTVGVTASWALLGLALVSVSVRPVVDATGLPRFLVNLDALLTPLAAGVVFVLALLAWSGLPRLHRTLTVLAAALSLSMIASWASATPRSLPSLALGGSVLLLLPIALYLAVMATNGAPVALLRRTLVLMVLLQLAVGLVQYVALAVAQKAPAGADLVDGTTSHNFWPVFALPASMALVLVGRDRLRYLWPLTVTVLAIYAEAKAALAVWLPIMVVLIGIDAVRRLRRHAETPDRSARGDRIDAVARMGLIVSAAAVVVVGLWWTPSVQGTWGVFVGHTQTLERFAATGERGNAAAPTLREAVDSVAASVTDSPAAALLGRGPANTTSHAAEVLAQGAQNGVSLPEPGPLARDLLTGADDLKFRDAQSSLLGVWGDLGTLGGLLYLLLCGGSAYALSRIATPNARWGSPRAWSIPSLAGGVLAGGTLLDWPEQASVVLPVLLTAVVLATSSLPSATASAEQGRLTRTRSAPPLGARVPERSSPTS